MLSIQGHTKLGGKDGQISLSQRTVRVKRNIALQDAKSVAKIPFLALTAEKFVEEAGCKLSKFSATLGGLNDKRFVARIALAQPRKESCN